MALVSYSDSESESEPSASASSQGPNNQQWASPPPPPSKAPFQTVVDRSNPRRIRIALPDTKPENNDANEEEEPMQKKARIVGGGGGAFSGFNSLLPAPKRRITNTTKDDDRTDLVNEAKTAPSQPRKVFSLKTSATPGFDGEAAHVETTISKEGQTGTNNDDGQRPGMIKEEPKLKGNVTMFKPLSVSRNNQKKKQKSRITTLAAESSAPVRSSSSAGTGGGGGLENGKGIHPQPEEPTKRPKVSLFSISANGDGDGPIATSNDDTTYKPLLLQEEGEEEEMEEQEGPTTTTAATEQGQIQPIQTLDHVADELNLSRSQRRHLFGNQQRQHSTTTQVLTFNADTEYSANQALARETDVSAVQHNPVRPIAPGKHTLQQLVNAASNQREALEESFATGRRNKKEAGSKYGW